MDIRLFQVDAFTNRLFAGNPAAVCPLDEWLSEATLQSIAAENNLSETAYLVEKGDEYHIRWFTPSSEIDLCGHATLASGYVVLEILRPELDEVQFHSASGILPVTRSGERYSMDFPSRPGKPVPCPDILREALGVEPRETLLSRDYLTVFESEESVRKIAPDFQLIAQLDSEGVIVTAPGEDCDFVSRCFFPGVGIPEDPVTGSAHCTLVPYWANVLNRSSFFCRQISARGGELWCELHGDRVKIAGECVLYLEGHLRLPLGS